MKGQETRESGGKRQERERYARMKGKETNKERKKNRKDFTHQLQYNEHKVKDFLFIILYY